MPIHVTTDSVVRGRGRGRRGRAPRISNYVTESDPEEDSSEDDTQPPSPPLPQHDIPAYSTQHSVPQASPPDPALAAIHAVLAQLVALQQAAAQPAAPPPAASAPLDFPKMVMLMKNIGTPSFGGSSDPMEADHWMESLDRNFAAIRCPTSFRKDIAVYYLERDARFWWTTVEQRFPPHFLTYDVFRQEFERKYFPDEARDRLEIQYLALTQGSGSVRAYEAEFTRLRRYAARAQEESEASVMRRFIRGLRPQIRCHLQVVEHHHLTDLVEKAVNVEESLMAERPTPIPSSMARPATTFQRRGGGTFQSQRKIRCATCHRHHSGKCTQVVRSCYVCGDTSHLARNCPKGHGAAPTVPRHIRCFICQQPGHYATSCPQRRSTDDAGPSRPQLPPPPAKRPATAARVYAATAAGPSQSDQGPLTGA